MLISHLYDFANARYYAQPGTTQKSESQLLIPLGFPSRKR
jgi:hypothetical protein